MITDPVLAGAAAADSAALAAAAASAEEALACHRDALAALAAGWRSETGFAATDSLQRQCEDATDVVAELHRIAAELASWRADWTESSNAGASPDAEQIAQRPPADVIAQPGTPVTGWAAAAPTAAPDPVPAPVSDPWAAQPSAAPWAPPVAAVAPAVPPASPAWQPGGSMPALPDLGGALVGLVAQIAQTLGSYSDNPAAPDGLPAEKASDPGNARPAHHKPAAAKRPEAPGSAASAVPKKAAAQPLSVNPPPIPPPPWLLAAERPPDPIPAAPQATATPAPEPPSAPAPPPAAVAPPTSSTDARTPCEIAADELPKVGE